MKIIDLVNKKLNNEEMPKKFKFDDSTFIYSKGDYIYEYGNISFFNDYCSPIYNFECFLETLNCEIEIIEEDKKIEKIIINSQGNIEKKYIDGSRTVLPCVGEEVLHIAYKVNELIDEVNKLKGDNDDR